MKKKLHALVMRDSKTGKVLSVYNLSDGACECEYIQIEYSSNLVTMKELKDYLISEKVPINCRKNHYQQYAEVGNFFLEGQADGMPSIGLCKVALETNEVEWK